MRKVLIIEDEKSVSNAIRALLERERWQVFEAFTAVQAWQHFSGPSKIELLIADVVLPSQNGAAIARQMLEQDADLHCILMSGYPIADLYDRALITEELLRSPRISFLEKPFTLRGLLDVIDSVATALPRSASGGL